MINTVVFVVVLAVFSVAVYFSVMICLQQEHSLRLTTLTDAVIGSFDEPDNTSDENDPQELIPEILRSDKQDFLMKGATLQWFDASGKLVVQKGPLQIVAPFSQRRSFQTQSN